MIVIRTTDRIMQVLIPILVNVLLAAVLYVAMPAASGPIAQNAAIDVDPGREVAAAALPSPRLDQIIASAQSTIGSNVTCAGPWLTGRLLNWSCRTPDLLAILRGPNREAIEELDLTWFGFEPSRSTLFAWAVAAATPDDRAQIAAWTDATAGTDGSTVFGGIKLVAGGSRGALTLIVAGLGCGPGSARPKGSGPSC